VDEQLAARLRAAVLDEAEVLGREVRVERELELAEATPGALEADELAGGLRLVVDHHAGNGSDRPLRLHYLAG
jgi:hypothetical protein